MQLRKVVDALLWPMVTGGLLCSSAAMAEESNEGSSVQEVIVTATKRAENIQDVPISVQAVGAKMIERANVVSVGDLQRLVPSFYYYGNSSPRTGANSIRGVTTRTTQDSEEASVSTVVDGVVLGRQAMSFMDLYDMSRVEVLAGPQGSLFGKNSSAGVLSIITADPTDHVEGYVKGLYASRNEVQVDGAISGPLNDKVSGRLAAHYHRADGELRAVSFNNKNINNINNWGVRGKLKFEDGDTRILIAADYASDDVRCCAWTILEDGSPTSQTLRNILTASGITASPTNRRSGQNILPTAKTTNSGVSMTADWSLLGHDLTSITAWRQYSTHSVTDNDGQAVTTSHTDFISKSHQFSEELRAANQVGPIDYTLGVFYFNIKIDDDITQFFPARTPAGAYQRVIEPLTTENAAVFGDIKYNFAGDKATLRVGGRHTWETYTIGVDKISNFAVPYALFDSQKTREWSGVAAFQYRWTDEVMTYVSASRGFKGAAYNQPGVADAPLPSLVGSRVKPEITTNYEAGIRSRWLDRTLTLNLTVFNTLFEDYQSTTYDAGANRFQLLNVGAVRTKGAELQYAWTPIENLQIDGGVTYTDAYYDSFENGQCGLTSFRQGRCVAIGSGLTTNLTGKRLFHAPKWRYTVNASYTFRNLSDSFDVYVQGTYAHRSWVVAEASVDPLLFIKGYGTLDARVAATSKDGKYEVALFGKNLTDETILDARLFAPSYGGQSTGVPAIAGLWGRSRSIGVQVIARH